VTARADRAIALLAGGALAVLFTGCFAVQVAVWTAEEVDHSSRRVIPGPVRELRVDAHGGDVTLVPARGNDVIVESRVAGSLHTPSLRVNVDGSSVAVVGGCAEFNLGRCRASLLVYVPPDTPVVVDATSGDLVASGLFGNAELHTASGDVSVRRLGGRVELESASGDVDAVDLDARMVRAHTASGDVNLAFDVAPETAEAESASGDARIAVPPGDETYRVEVDTNSGDPRIGVSEDPSSSRLLRAQTNSGDAEVGYGG
jgi:DUF4097 and DUF4098 domain-containing protein YvlB